METSPAEKYILLNYSMPMPGQPCRLHQDEATCDSRCVLFSFSLGTPTFTGSRSSSESSCLWVVVAVAVLVVLLVAAVVVVVDSSGSNWVFTSCQPHTATSGRPNTRSETPPRRHGHRTTVNNLICLSTAHTLICAHKKTTTFFITH